MWLNIVTIVARSVCLCPHTCAKTSMPLAHLSMTRSGQCHAKHAENAVLVYNTCLDKSAAVYKAYLIGTEN